MSHDWLNKLAQIEAALSEQNERLSMVKETLANLPGHTSIALTDEWKAAFEDAVEPVVTVNRSAKPAPVGAIRA